MSYVVIYFFSNILQWNSISIWAFWLFFLLLNHCLPPTRMGKSFLDSLGIEIDHKEEVKVYWIGERQITYKIINRIRTMSEGLRIWLRCCRFTRITMISVPRTSTIFLKSGGWRIKKRNRWNQWCTNTIWVSDTICIRYGDTPFHIKYRI